MESATKKRKLENENVLATKSGLSATNRSNKKKIDERSHHCPYLDTINRGVLDFDFEKLCSISLSKINCYACLVCGKYFQGKSTKNKVANLFAFLCCE